MLSSYVFTYAYVVGGYWQRMVSVTKDFCINLRLVCCESRGHERLDEYEAGARRIPSLRTWSARSSGRERWRTTFFCATSAHADTAWSETRQSRGVEILYSRLCGTSFAPRSQPVVTQRGVSRAVDTALKPVWRAGVVVLFSPSP